MHARPPDVVDVVFRVPNCVAVVAVVASLFAAVVVNGRIADSARVRAKQVRLWHLRARGSGVE